MWRGIFDSGSPISYRCTKRISPLLWCNKHRSEVTDLVAGHLSHNGQGTFPQPREFAEEFPEVVPPIEVWGKPRVARTTLFAGFPTSETPQPCRLPPGMLQEHNRCTTPRGPDNAFCGTSDFGTPRPTPPPARLAQRAPMTMPCLSYHPFLGENGYGGTLQGMPGGLGPRGGVAQVVGPQRVAIRGAGRARSWPPACLKRQSTHSLPCLMTLGSHMAALP